MKSILSLTLRFVSPATDARAVMNARFLLLAGLACVAIAVVLVYFLYSMRVNPSLEIVYSSVEDFDPVMLSDKSPILLQEQFVDANALSERLLKYAYVRKRSRALPPGELLRVGASWAACFFASTIPDSDAEETLGVTLAHPNSVEAVLDVVMKPDQVLLVPRFWHVKNPCRTGGGGDDDGTTMTVVSFSDFFSLVS